METYLECSKLVILENADKSSLATDTIEKKSFVYLKTSEKNTLFYTECIKCHFNCYASRL